MFTLTEVWRIWPQDHKIQLAGTKRSQGMGFGQQPNCQLGTKMKTSSLDSVQGINVRK